ncbi:MAG: hypothetical protein ACI8VW_000097 [bacterium]|jgi:hypothetical protein
MGRLVKDPQDINIDNYMEEFYDLSNLSNKIEDRLRLVPSLSKRLNVKGTRRKAKKNLKIISSEDDDWQDPQDDIMYGFRD